MGGERIKTVALDLIYDIVFTGALDHCVRGWSLSNDIPYLNTKDGMVNQHDECS